VINTNDVENEPLSHIVTSVPRKRVASIGRMWLAHEPRAGSGERGAGKKRAGSRDCRKKSRNR
jgi:hypothetical protein